MRFIFTDPTFISSANNKKEKREFYIPKLSRERGIYGTEFEVKLHNELNQKAIAKECAAWIRKKAIFKSNSSNKNVPIGRIDRIGSRNKVIQLLNYWPDIYLLLGLRKRGADSRIEDSPSMYFPIYYNEKDNIIATSEIDRGIRILPQDEQNLFLEELEKQQDIALGYANAPIKVNNLLQNIKAVQCTNNIKESTELKLEKGQGRCSLDIEMETGAGCVCASTSRTSAWTQKFAATPYRK